LETRHHIEQNLRVFRLSGMLENLDLRLKQAEDEYPSISTHSRSELPAGRQRLMIKRLLYLRTMRLGFRLA